MLADTYLNIYSYEESSYLISLQKKLDPDEETSKRTFRDLPATINSIHMPTACLS